MLLIEVVTTSSGVAATRSRKAKVTALAGLLNTAEPDEIELVFLRELLVAHAELTGSAKAAALLDSWDQAIGSFWRVAPRAEVAAIERAHEGTA